MKTSGYESEDAFSGETVPFEVKWSHEVAKEVLTNSRKQYGTPKKRVEAYLEKLMAEPEKKSRKPGNTTSTTKDKPKRASRKSEGPRSNVADEKYEG